jgi:diketogulonate reductase-like aldo/keto reductase
VKDVLIAATWEAMERLAETGKVRIFGVSDSGKGEIEELLST